MAKVQLETSFLAKLFRVDGVRHPKDPPSAHITRSLLQIAQAIILFGLIAWLIHAGAAAMEYRWQWYRVGPFFYRFIDDEFIPGPLIRGIIVTLQLAGVSSVITAFVINAFIMRPCFDP